MALISVFAAFDYFITIQFKSISYSYVMIYWFHVVHTDGSSRAESVCGNSVSNIISQLMTTSLGKGVINNIF